MVNIQVDRDGAAILAVHVQPRASQDEIAGTHGDALKVRVTAPPDGGRANAAVLALLADRLDVPARSVELVSGHQHRSKRVRIAGLDPATLRERLSRIGC